MPRPVHVSLMQLLRVINRINIEGSVVLELESDAFDTTLSYLQDQLGKSNQPTDIEANNFKIGDVIVRRV